MLTSSTLIAATALSFSCPFAVTPNWGAMTVPAEWNRAATAYKSGDLVPVPAYSLPQLTGKTMDDLTDLRDHGNAAQKKSAIADMTAKIYYSTRFMGTYDLDAGEYTGDHRGVDLKEPAGTAIRAIAAGTVVSGKSTILGNYVTITHADGLTSTYGHMKRIIKKSGTVRAGQRIGLVGLTGNTASPHLHLEVEKNGVLVNPMSLLPYPCQ